MEARSEFASGTAQDRFDFNLEDQINDNFTHALDVFVLVEERCCLNRESPQKGLIPCAELGELS